VGETIERGVVWVGGEWRVWVDGKGAGMWEVTAMDGAVEKARWKVGCNGMSCAASVGIDWVLGEMKKSEKVA